MKKHVLSLLLIICIGAILATGCSSTGSTNPTQAQQTVQSREPQTFPSQVEFDKNSIIGVWDYVINPNSDYVRLTITAPESAQVYFCQLGQCSSSEMTITYNSPGSYGYRWGSIWGYIKIEDSNHLLLVYTPTANSANNIPEEFVKEQ
jgi:hypothetical protein